MSDVKNIKLMDIDFPDCFMRHYKGPRYGVHGVRKMMKIKDRPFVGTIVKPKVGLNEIQHAKVAYESWLGGCDVVKDDENLSSQKFNEFDKRAALTLEMCDKAEEETGEKKAYLINVTAETEDMLKRADLVKELGGKFVMHDIITAGFASLQTLRKNTKLAIHAHRAMHGAFTENPKHGISMAVIAEFARLCGVDTLHIGTGIGKMLGGWKEVEEIKEKIELQVVKKTHNRLKENWFNKKPVMAVCSGGIYPGHVSYLMKHFGNDIVIQAGGGIHGHPKGTLAGAMAMRQAVDKVLGVKGRTTELDEAMDFWGKIRF